jgi:hypothetical protein
MDTNYVRMMTGYVKRHREKRFQAGKLRQTIWEQGWRHGNFSRPSHQIGH